MSDTVLSEVPKPSAEVAAVFADWPPKVRAGAERLRHLIHETAVEIGSAPVQESLKWGQPSFSNGRAGTPVRLGYVEGQALGLRLYVHCSTSLIDQCRTRFPELTYEKNRAICLDAQAPLPEETLRSCLALALTYHTKEKQAHG